MRAFQINQTKHFCGNLLLILAETAGGSVELQLFPDGQQVKENVVLRTVTHGLAKSVHVRSRVEAHAVFTLHSDRAGGLLIDANQAVEDRRFTRPVRTEQGGDLVFVQGEGDVVDGHFIRTESFDQVVDVHDGRAVGMHSCERCTGFGRRRDTVPGFVRRFRLAFAEEIPAQRNTVFTYTCTQIVSKARPHISLFLPGKTFSRYQDKNQ